MSTLETSVIQKHEPIDRSFADETFVYLLLDVCLGGELGDLLQEKGKLGEVPRHNEHQKIAAGHGSIPFN
jgi:hypothetical protein